jgi:hypothetical protein
MELKKFPSSFVRNLGTYRVHGECFKFLTYNITLSYSLHAYYDTAIVAVCFCVVSVGIKHLVRSLQNNDTLERNEERNTTRTRCHIYFITRSFL